MKTSLTFLCVLLLTVFASAEVKQPNVVLIFADDMGYGDVSAYDAKSKIKTPHLDRLAKSLSRPPNNISRRYRRRPKHRRLGKTPGLQEPTVSKSNRIAVPLSWPKHGRLG